MLLFTYNKSSHLQRTTAPARSDDLTTTDLGVSDQSLSYASWLLRYMAENLEYYVNNAENPDIDLDFVKYGEYRDIDLDYDYYVNNTIGLV